MLAQPLSAHVPSSQGFRMPAEWEPHAATWLSWPYNPNTWEGHLAGAEEAFTEIIAALTPVESVRLLVPDATVEARARGKIEQSKGVRMDRLTFHQIESGDVWIRDYGPLFLKNHEGKKHIGWSKFGYNALGGKYSDLLIGNDVPGKMPIQDMPHFDAGMILEGGSIDVNGSGTLLTTESCLLSQDRNPDLTRKKIEEKLKDFLGATNVLWLSEGIAGDDTTGHVDDLTRFVNRTTVVTAIEENANDPNCTPLRKNRERLSRMKAEDGTPLRVLDLPMPQPFEMEGRRMAASYANFYIANGLVLVPTYRCPADADALALFERCFPDRKILGINCRELIWGFGSIHCVTQQEPK